MILPNLHHNLILVFQPSPPAVSPCGSKSSNAHQTTILCVFAVKLPRRAPQTPPKAKDLRDLAIRVPHARQSHLRPRPPPRDPEASDNNKTTNLERQSELSSSATPPPLPAHTPARASLRIWRATPASIATYLPIMRRRPLKFRKTSRESTES